MEVQAVLDKRDWEIAILKDLIVGKGMIATYAYKGQNSEQTLYFGSLEVCQEVCFDV